MSSILFGYTMVPNIEQDYILHLGYSILCRSITRFSHKKSFLIYPQDPLHHVLGTRHFLLLRLLWSLHAPTQCGMGS